MPDVTLRPLTVKDCTPQYLGWLNDPRVNRWLETRWEDQTLDTIRAYVREQTKHDDRRLWAICVNGDHIGNIKLGPIHPRHGFADVSYFIGEVDAWGKGYATQAVKQACDFGFKMLQLHRIQAGVYDQNGASMNVLRKAGFSYEGTLRRQLRTDNGWADHMLYGRCCDQGAL